MHCCSDAAGTYSAGVSSADDRLGAYLDQAAKTAANEQAARLREQQEHAEQIARAHRVARAEMTQLGETIRQRLAPMNLPTITMTGSGVTFWSLGGVAFPSNNGRARTPGEVAKPLGWTCTTGGVLSLRMQPVEQFIQNVEPYRLYANGWTVSKGGDRVFAEHEDYELNRTREYLEHSVFAEVAKFVNSGGGERLPLDPSMYWTSDGPPIKLSPKPVVPEKKPRRRWFGF